MALWRPEDEPPDLVLDDGWYIRRSAQTRRRIAALHLVASGVLSGQHLAASAEVDRLGPVGLVLATVRGLLLAGDLLVPSLTVDDAGARSLCATASGRAQKLARESGLGHDPALLREAIRAGERMIDEVFFGPPPEQPLLFRVADSLGPSQEHRYGVACVCIAGYASVLEAHDPAGRDARALAEEQAALALAYAQGGVVRWNGGRLVLHA
jgi:hypothetical protein